MKRVSNPRNVLPSPEREFSTLPQRVSNPAGYAAPMRNRRHEPFRLPETEVLTSFGEAKIVKHLDGRLEIVGGTPEERDEVSVWMRQFLQPQGHLE